MRNSIPEQYGEYFSWMGRKFEEVYLKAKEARSKGFDPSFEPESLVTVDLAERVEKSVGPPNIANRIRELSKIIPREELAFKIAEEIVYGKFGPVGENAAEQAIRTALAILDEGVTVAPIEGISSVRVKMNPDRTKYLAVYFAGPIRSAGGTEMALTLLVSDFVRSYLGLDRYKATEAEARRFVEEVRLYEREVARFQYKVSDEELFNAIMNLPVEVNGVETDPVEVASFRNLPRVETNRVRGGALRVVNDGLIGRAQKVLKIVEKLGITGWAWLKEIRSQIAENEGAREFMYMEDIIAGRPIFSFPSMPGGFRLRYGRCRNTGLAALGVHPATMIILRNFLASGTQLRIEKPGKAGVVLPVESIEPPIVKLKNGSVIRVESPRVAENILNSIESILFLGDLLIAFGEFLENNYPLLPSGIVEEWWSNLLREAAYESGKISSAAASIGIDEERIRAFILNPLEIKPTPREALKLSIHLGVPLHPRYTYFWSELTTREFKDLREAFLSANMIFKDDFPAKMEVKAEQNLKLTLEKLCVPHALTDGRIIIGEDEAPILYACLGLWKADLPVDASSTLEIIRKISGVNVYSKVGTFLGARMGRPEKAKRREMKPTVHCLFPLGLAGGPRRNIVDAARSKILISVEIVNKQCPSCGETAYTNVCFKCGGKTVLKYRCPKCNRPVQQDVCPVCKVSTVCYEQRSINIKELFESACRRLNITSPPELVKGVRGLTSEDRTPEPIEKGILRAKYNLSVFKDGTVRFDSTNAPLTHFKPIEIGVSIEKLRELGYKFDSNGDPLADPNQLCPLKIQDVIVPDKCAEYFLRVAAFIDELLQKFYGLPPYYNAKSKEDLVGHIIIGLSPHTSVGVVGRIIGFTKANVCFANPFWHAAKRRDCDGDEDSLSLALDVLLNFSKAFLPVKIGGMMDAPLLLNLLVNPLEVEDEVYNMEVAERLPTAFFEEANRCSDPKIVSDIVETVYHRLSGECQFEPLGFSHHVGDINIGNRESSYKKLASMLDKVKEQLSLADSIRAVKAEDVARRVLSTHFMRDVVGNLKAFSTQKVRCMKCNAKFRRPPLQGICPKCGGKISLTVYRGAIEKYLEVADELVKRYRIGKYHEQRLQIIRDEIESLFRGAERKKQSVLGDFM